MDIFIIRESCAPTKRERKKICQRSVSISLVQGKSRILCVTHVDADRYLIRQNYESRQGGNEKRRIFFDRFVRQWQTERRKLCQRIALTSSRHFASTRKHLNPGRRTIGVGEKLNTSDTVYRQQYRESWNFLVQLCVENPPFVCSSAALEKPRADSNERFAPIESVAKNS